MSRKRCRSALAAGALAALATVALIPEVAVGFRVGLTPGARLHRRLPTRTPRRQPTASTRLHSLLDQEQAKAKRPDDSKVRSSVARVLTAAEKEERLRLLDEYDEKLQASMDQEWADTSKRHGIDWLFERYRRAFVGQARYPKTVNEMGGLPLFGKDGIPAQLGGIQFWARNFGRLPARSKYSDVGIPGSKPGGLDTFRILFNNLLQFLLGNESEDGAPVASWDFVESLRREGPFKFLYYLATGNLQELAGGPLFLLLNTYYLEYGPVFKLAFGPRSFVVVSDPVAAKHILTTQAASYDKGMLAEILEPIMGKGLIPADPDTWRERRRVIVPGFHKRWLNRMITLFAQCNSGLIASLYEAADAADAAEAAGAAAASQSSAAASTAAAVPKAGKGAAGWVDMEEKFCSVTLDIIGNAVFNYDFNSATTESPVVKAVYRCLREAEHRSTAFIPYWQIPGLAGANSPLLGQRMFAEDLGLLNGKLDECIAKAFEAKADLDVGQLEAREYSADDDASLLRFLVDMKGEAVSDKQLRDDLMTMLVAGHETTAALLTWTLFEMANARDQFGKDFLDRARAEVDAVLGDRAVPTYDDLASLPFVRTCLIEGLRLYPEPPVLIRRALDGDVLPAGAAGFQATIPRGADIFVSTWNLHRSADLWEEPLRYNPDRWAKPFSNPKVEGWKGFRPEKISGLYPDEQATDFAFLPFGGGARKCVGDQFAMLEATSTFALMLRRFEFEFGPEGPGAVGLRTGATIHTQNGLWMRVRARAGVPRTGAQWVEPSHPVLNPGGTALKQQLAAQLRQQEKQLARDAAVAAAAAVEPVA